MSTTDHGNGAPAAEVTWDPPGPGHWELDLSHCLGSMTPIMQDVQGTGATNGMRELFALYGMPADTLDARFVNGFFYTRIRPLLAPDRPAKKAPPAFLLKAGLQASTPSCAGGPSRPSERWPTSRGVRPCGPGRTTSGPPSRPRTWRSRTSTCRASTMPAWPAHYEDTLAALRRGYHRHFILHGYDLGPIGFLLVACQRWGIDAADVVPALQGASPPPPSRPACWPGCGPRWRPAAPRRPRSTRSGPCRPRRRPRSTSTSATAACRCSAGTTSTASPWASCPRSC